ncbi:MAG: tetratricopeptide repeat protein [Candidatus Cloacimonetes bacterium]|nr:tetratricopeptide repeat protein [Candidatus Cloacimonadota bacterium]
MKILYTLIISVFIFLNCLAGYHENFVFAKKMYQDKLYDEAVRIFEEVITEARTSPEADESLYNIGTIYLLQEKYSEAESVFRRHLNGYPNSLFGEKSLNNLAISQYQQSKFSDALINFQLLIKTYPTTDSANSSAKYIPLCLYKKEDFHNCILESEKLLENYPQKETASQILLIQAQAYFKSNIFEKADSTIDSLISDYPDTEARWEAVIIKTDFMKNQNNSTNITDFLTESLQKKPPRRHEEIIRHQLAVVYLNSAAYSEADSEFNLLINKFNNSAQLDRYLIDAIKIKSKLNSFKEVIELCNKHELVFKNSPLKNEKLYYHANALAKEGNHGDSAKIISEISATDSSRDLIFRVKSLEAELAESSGQHRKAITQYQDLINNFSDFNNNENFLMKTGDIYFNVFRFYDSALKYYEQIITNYSDEKYHNQALYKISLCYELTERYNEAVDALTQINPENETDTEFINEIKNKIEYLRNYKITDYKSAFTNLLTALNSYVNYKDDSTLKIRLAEILASDLKDFENSSVLLDDLKSADVAYKKASILLKSAEKYKKEGNTPKLNITLDEFGKLKNRINYMNVSQDKLNELEIRLSLLNSEKPYSDSLIEQIKQHINSYPESPSYNNFILILSEFYEEKDLSESINYLKKLKDSQIKTRNFSNAQLKIADYYYNQNQYEVALNYYRKAENLITIRQPAIYYQFAVCLLKTGFETEAVDKLAFLINNFMDFKELTYAVEQISTFYRNTGQIEKAIDYSLKLPANKRTSEFYQRLAEDYIAQDELEKAINALTLIENKSDETLFDLAELYRQTNNWSIAEYTYKQIILDNKNQRLIKKSQESLSEIYYRNEDFKSCLSTAEKLLPEINNNTHSIDIVNLLKRIIVSNYRLSNRPRAEALYKEHRDILEKNLPVVDEIRLNEAIYYRASDANKAESILSKLIKKETNLIILSQAYYWRGVVYLQVKKNDKAIADFKIAANSEDSFIRDNANLKLGTISYSDEKYQDALSYYYEVIEKDKTGKIAVLAAKNYALVCKTIHEWSRAISAYEIILERWGDQDMEGETLFNIGFCYFRDKKYDKAIEMFNRALPLIQESELQAETQYWIGDSYFGKEDYERAVSAYLKVGYNNPDVTQWAASAEIQAGESYYLLGRYEQAKQIFNKTLSKFGPGSDWGKEAKKRLESYGFQ